VVCPRTSSGPFARQWTSWTRYGPDTKETKESAGTEVKVSGGVCLIVDMGRGEKGDGGGERSG